MSLGQSDGHRTVWFSSLKKKIVAEFLIYLSMLVCVPSNKKETKTKVASCEHEPHNDPPHQPPRTPAANPKYHANIHTCAPQIHNFSTMSRVGQAAGIPSGSGIVLLLFRQASMLAICSKLRDQGLARALCVAAMHSYCACTCVASAPYLVCAWRSGVVHAPSAGGQRALRYRQKSVGRTCTVRMLRTC